MPKNNTPTSFTPLLPTYNWNEEWQALQTIRRRADDAAHWNKRAETYSTNDSPHSYVEQFLELAAIQPGETVFDMGCGTGALSVPLAERGHRVYAGDFSSGMLDVMNEQLHQRRLTSVEPLLVSWEDNWADCGITERMVDVSIASRSIATADLKSALLRLSHVARRRACITLSTGTSPRLDERILNAIGLQSPLGKDYLYAFAILAHEGFLPEVAYIHSTRRESFDSAHDAYNTLGRMVDDATIALTSSQRAAAHENLRTWLEHNLIDCPQQGALDQRGIPEKALMLRIPRTVTWAFIAWNTQQPL